MFSQHCLAPLYSPISYVPELSEELGTNLATLKGSAGTKQVMKDLELHLQAFIHNKPIPEIMPKQRMTAFEQRVENKPTNKGENGAEQRVTNPLANNQTAPQVL